jgi:hypothetical protein
MAIMTRRIVDGIVLSLRRPVVQGMIEEGIWSSFRISGIDLLNCLSIAIVTKFATAFITRVSRRDADKNCFPPPLDPRGFFVRLETDNPAADYAEAVVILHVCGLGVPKITHCGNIDEWWVWLGVGYDLSLWYGKW